MEISLKKSLPLLHLKHMRTHFGSLVAFNIRSIKRVLWGCACAFKRNSFIIRISAYRQKLPPEPGLFLGKTTESNQVSCYNVKWKYKDAWLFCVRTNRFILSSVFFYHLQCDILEWGSWHIIESFRGNINMFLSSSSPCYHRGKWKVSRPFHLLLRQHALREKIFASCFSFKLQCHDWFHF